MKGHRALLLLVVLLLGVTLACGPSLAARVTALDDQAREVRDRHRVEQALESALGAVGGAGAVRACGPVALDPAAEAGPMRPALAWLLDLPLHDIERPRDADVVTTFARRGRGVDRELAGGAAVRRAANEEWVVWSTCPDPTGR